MIPSRLIAVCTVLAVSGCDKATTIPAKGAEQAASIDVVIESRSQSKLTGKASFTEVDGGVRVVLKVTGGPTGKIATHIHEVGDCSAPDGASAKSHFNPKGHKHGLPAGNEKHLGDLGNIEIGADGSGSIDVVASGANLKPGDPHSFLGRSIIVHAKEDDGGQPVGNAGARIGCGVISPK